MFVAYLVQLFRGRAIEEAEEAVEAYENAIKYNPKYAMARMNLGIIQAEKLGPSP